MARTRSGRVGFKTRGRYKKTIQNFVDGLSRDVTIYLGNTRVECPNCYYDKVNGKSSGIPKVAPASPTYFTVGRCPVCSGKGVLTTSRRKTVKALVIWNPAGEGMNSFTFTSAGVEGASRVQLKMDPSYLDTIKTAIYFVVDGIRCKLSNPPLIRGLGNKSLLVIELFTDDKPKIGSGETL